MARKKTKRSFTPVEFGYDDGRADTVMLSLLGSGVTLQGDLLHKAASAYFSLKGYAVSPSLKSLGLWKGSRPMRRESGSATHYVVSDRNLRDGKKGPLHISMGLRAGYLRLWIQSTTHPHLYFNIYFSQADEEEFGRRLAEAGGWDVDA